jgi:hypothetical protein
VEIKMTNNKTLAENEMILVEGTSIEIKNSTTENKGIIISVNGIEMILVEKEGDIHSIRVWNSNQDEEDYEYKQIIEEA